MLTMFYDWYTKNRLALNIPKTNVMLITNRNINNDDHKLNIKVNEDVLEQVKFMSYLGVDVDENLIWDVHVKKLTRVLSYKLYTLNKASKFMNSTLLNTIYLRSIQPCLDYACSVWGNCSEGSKFSLLSLQKRAARIVLKNFDYENYSGVELIKSLKWQNLEQRRDYYLATQMYKCVHGFAPKLLCDMIVMASDIHDRVTRNTSSLNVYIPKPNVECYPKSCKYAVIELNLNWCIMNSTRKNSELIQNKLINN
jgi:phage gp46-like protein